MQPSAKYVTDMTFDYGNGAVIDLTKEIQSIYSNGDTVDRSICYTSPSFNFSSLSHINEVIDVFNSQTDTENSYGTIQASVYSRTLKDWTRAAPSSDIWSGYLLNHTSNIDLNFFWGYGGSTNRGTGGNRRLTKGLDFNTIVVPMGNIEVMDKSVYDNIDYDTYPTNQYGSASNPSTHNINLKTLDDNSNDYYVNNASFSSAYIWQPDNSSWVSTYINPSIMVDGEDAGGIMLYNFPFLGFTGGLRMTAESPDGHVSKTGGSDSNKVYKNLNDGFTTHYCLGFTDNFTIRQTRFATFDDMNNWGQAKYIEIYGLNVGTHKLYFEHQEIDLGDSVLCLQFNIEMKYSGWWVPPHVYCDFQVYMKGSTVSKYLACMGLYFTYDGSTPTGLTPLTLHTSDKVWLGAMNENGNTTGEWVKGIEIFNYTGYNKIGNTDNPNYDPSKSGGSTGDDMEAMATGATGSSGGFTHFYIMSPQDLIDFLADFIDHASSGETLTNNLVCSYILGIPSSEFCATEEVPIAIHNSAQGTPFVSQANYSHITATNNLLVVGSFNVPRITNTFYDFAPYSTYEVFIPCCGWVSLPDTVAGRSINVEMYIDIASCCLKAAVKTNDLGICGVINGVLGAPIPMAVIESGLLRGNNIQAGLGIIGGGINTGIGIGTGNAMGIGFGVQQILSGLVDCTIVGNTNYTQQKGGTGDITQFAMGHKCYMKVTHPDIDPVVNEYIFGHSVGYLCNSIGKLSEYIGFTVCGNPHVTFSASAEEREEIERLLSSGVIL